MPLKENKKDAAELVQKRFSASEKYVQSYFTKFQDFYVLYRSQLQAGKLPWRSNLFISKTFEIIETISPRIALAQKTFKTVPVEGMDVNNSRAYTDLLKFQFEKTGLEQWLEELVKETLIYGTGVVKVTWGANNMPQPEVVDIFDFYPDPKARYLEEAKYVIHRVERDIEDLKENPNYDKGVIKKLEEGGGDVKDEQKNQRLGLMGHSADDSTRKRFEVLEYWGLYEGKPYIIATCEGEVLRCDPSPYPFMIPFVVVNDNRVPHELYGIGEIEPIESLQNELNDVRNQRMDNVKINLNNMWVITAGGVQFEDELIPRPGGSIHQTRPDGLRPLEKNPIDSSAFTEESVIKSDMERITGANSPLSGALVSPMGGNTGGVMNRTATAYQGSINQADKRFTSKVNQIKWGLKKVGTMFLQLDQTFMDKSQVIRVVGKYGEGLAEVMPEDIKAGFDLIVDIEYMDEFQQMQNNISLLQTLASIPGFDTAKFATNEILEKAGFKNAEEYILPPQPPAPEQPKINFQFRGDVMPDAVAQIIDKHEGIKTNPSMVASAMRAKQTEEESAGAEILSKLNMNQNVGGTRTTEEI